LVGPKDFSAKFLTYGNAIFEVDLSRKLYIITFTEPGRISFVSDDISGGDGIASGYESGKVVLITFENTRRHRVKF
jgi:hypothetical protein